MVIAKRMPEPVLFSAINVTPFIDVMLVLLIVMILSIPIATHKVPIDLPGTSDPVGPEPLPPAVLAIDRQGALYWDGAKLDETALAARLAALRQSGAGLHLQTDPETRYARFDSVLATVKTAGITRLGFVGNRPLDD
jgi:biopolymer transport protein ExbD